MNLEYVLDSVADLLPDLAGKTGIASDHGNHLGDRSAPIPFREWGHPPTTYTRPLVKVPWFVVDADDRRPIESDPPVDESRAEDQQTVEERLNDLGYV